MPFEGDKEIDENSGDKTFDYSASGGEESHSDIKRVIDELGTINRRLNRLELKSNAESSSRQSPACPTFLSGKSPPINLQAPTNPRDYLDHRGPVGTDLFHKETTDVDEFSEIQEQFNGLKSSVEKVILPPHFKLHDSRTGIKREDQPVLNVVSKCGRYIETALKLLSQCQEGEPADLGPVVVTLTANLKFLQDEYAALLVKGRFDNNTSQLFRSLQKHSSGFDSHCLQNVRVAAELSSISTRFQNTGSYRGGFNRGGYRGRGRDIFHSLRGASYPRFRAPYNQGFSGSSGAPKDNQDDN